MVGDSTKRWPSLLKPGTPGYGGGKERGPGGVGGVVEGRCETVVFVTETGQPR